MSSTDLELADAERLRQLEHVVASGVRAFLVGGLALWEIHERGLYRVSHATWEGYLRDRWGLSVQAAHRVESAARCARAIRRAGLELPGNVSAEMLRPLAPSLRRGDEAVVEAWRVVVAVAGSRGLSGERVRGILAAHGTVTVAPDQRRAPLRPIGQSVSRALVRARALVEEYAGELPPAAVRSHVLELAAQARELAAVLERFGDAEAATARLVAVEAAAAPARGRVLVDDGATADLCVGHGAARDAAGRCVACGRADVDTSAPAPPSLRRRASAADRVAVAA